MTTEAKETKTTRKPRSQKLKTETKTETVEVAQPQVNDLATLMQSMTPELLAQFTALIQAQSQPQVVSEQVVVAEQKPKQITKSYLNSIGSKEVVVRSVSSGSVGFKSPKTGMKYTWTQKGETEIMTIGEVLVMHNNSKLFLLSPLLYVEDDEVNEGLELQQVVELIKVLEDIDVFLKQPIKKIEKVVNEMTYDNKKELADTVASKIASGDFGDIRVIRLLEELLNKKFNY